MYDSGMILFLMAASFASAWAQVDEGRQIYMGSCSGCHGATGEGSQGPSLLSGRASRLADRALFQTIKNGLPGTSMPGFPMGDDKVRNVVAFVRSLTAPAISARVTGGDAARGKEIFFGAGKCSSCHMLLNKGGYPGPDLSNIAAERTLLQLRESIAKPSARVGEGFEGVTAILKDGRKVEGVAKNHNNYSVQIVDRNGRLHLLTQIEVAKLEFREGSMMPAVSSAEQISDLVAFLAGQSTRPYEGGSR